MAIVPSLAEIFGLVALEAMSHGTPVIAHNVGNLPHLIGDGGIAVPFQQGPEGLWRATRRLLDDPIRYRRLSRAAYHLAQDYRPAHVADQLLEGGELMGGAATPSQPLPPLLLVDGHNLLWGATFGFPAEIRSRDKTRLLTDLFGFFALLRVAIRDDVTEPPEVIVVFDGQYGSNDRKQIDPTYKAQRPIDEAALAPIRFLPDVKRGLTDRGIAWIEIDHAEADDVIATLVHTTPDPRRILLMLRDRDYYQLVTDRVHVLNTKMRSGHRHITPDEVYARHHVTPAQWSDFRALTGDPADNIPGVRGIGDKTAVTLLAGGLTLDDLPTSGRLDTGRARAVREEYDLALTWRDMIRLNPDITLPLHSTGHASEPLPRPADIVEELGLW